MAGNATVLRGNGNGGFAAPIPHSPDGTVHTAVATADFNADGKLDAVVTSSDTGTVSLLLGNGDGTLRFVDAFATGTSPSGVVVGDFQQSGGLSGFYLEEEDFDQDQDSSTSEGVFVFNSTAVAVGDHVQVAGRVTEFGGQTQISSATVTNLGPGTLPTATPAALPVTALSDLERFEGMRVIFPQDLFISEFFNYDRFGEILGMARDNRVSIDVMGRGVKDSVLETGTICLEGARERRAMDSCHVKKVQQSLHGVDGALGIEGLRHQVIDGGDRVDSHTRAVARMPRSSARQASIRGRCAPPTDACRGPSCHAIH